MTRKIKLVATLLILSALMPLALAISCDNLNGNDKTTCDSINQLSMNETEKTALFTLAFNPDRTRPNFDFVSYWNNKISMSSPPNGISTRNQGVIRGAWVKIVSLMPSVIENSNTLIDNSGKVKSEYNYWIQIPSGTESGNCKTEYSLKKNNAQLTISLNNQQIGNNKLNDFQTNSDAEFRATLNIYAETEVRHYKNYRYCYAYNSRGYCKWKTICEYSYTEIRPDNVIISDVLNAKLDKTAPKSEFLTNNAYLGNVRGILNASNFTKLVFSFDQSSYTKSEYTYEFNYTFPPYNLLTIIAKPSEEKQSKNINIIEKNNSFEFIVDKPINCLIDLFTHFKDVKIPCNAVYQSKNLIIATDKTHYLDNETINVDIEPKGLYVNLTYGNQNVLVKDSASFISNLDYNKVYASFGEESSEKVISVTEQSKLVLISQIILFFLVNYSVFSYLTKSALVIKWLTAVS
jgi:hypothetical protein